MSTLTLLLTALAYADADADGWEPPEDCDGSLTVRRMWVGDLSSVTDLVLVNATATYTGGTSPSEVRLTPRGGGWRV